jgi:opacity protein-like surface antigen
MFDSFIKNLLSDAAKNIVGGFAVYLVSVGILPTSMENNFVAVGVTIVLGIYTWYENNKTTLVADAAKIGTSSKTLSAAVAKTSAATAAMLLFAVMLFGSDARAQMLTKAPPVAPTPVCATSFCSGFYAGAGFDGNGTNADIIGSGLDNSVFGGGAVPSVQAGYQYWNGSLFIDGEGSIGYLVPAKGVSGAGALGIEEMQLGGKLSDLLGNSAPVTVPSAISADLISLYAAIGVAEMSGSNGFDSGAGAKFVLGPNMLMDLGYRYLTFNNGKNDNLVRVRFSYIFK